MSRNWKVVAAGLDLSIPEENLEKAQSTLDSLDRAFRPLIQLLSPEMEPAFHFECPSEEEQ
jgi:hypothetical protein